MPNARPLPPIEKDASSQKAKAKQPRPPKAKPAAIPEEPKPAAPKAEATPKPKAEPKPAKVPKEKLVQGYNITVVTGSDRGHGTDAKVFITLHGDKGSSERTALREDPDNFQEGSEDVFAVESPALGELTKIDIEHDDSQAASAWYLVKIVVRDNITKTKKYFHFNDWLASDRGSMEVRPWANACATLPRVAFDCGSPASIFFVFCFCYSFSPLSLF